MNLSSIPQVYADALCAWQALRKLGFSADDIYFMVHKEKDVPGKPEHLQVVFIILRTQDKEFSIAINPVNGTVEEIENQWRIVAEAANSGEIEDLNEYWEHSTARALAAPLVIAITNKGFVLPITQN